MPSRRSLLDANALGEVVAHQRSERDRSQPFNIGLMCIEIAAEHRNANPRALMHKALHLPVHLPLRDIGLAAGLLQELIETLIAPSTLVPRRLRVEVEAENEIGGEGDR